MNELQKTQDAAKSITNPDTQFKGYTLEEIRYQRALVTLQKEFCQAKMIRTAANLQKSNPFSAAGAASNLPGKVGLVATKLVTGLNYLDYAMLGFSIFGSIRKVYGFFRKKK